MWRRLKLAPLLRLDCEMNSGCLVPKTARCTHNFSVCFIRLLCPATTKNKGPFRIAFTHCSKSSDTSCRLTQIKERQKIPLVVSFLIEMKHKQHVHTVRHLNQSPDPRDITYDNRTAIQMHTCDTIQHVRQNR
jgi:hypothetical protein